MSETLVKLSIGVLPVLSFLALMMLLDVYKLVRKRALLLSIVAGVAVASIGYFANTTLQRSLDLDPTLLVRYVAPAVEETLKAAIVLVLIRTHRVGFLVDAAIHGFAVGAGFALLENVYYFRLLPEAGPGAWVLRGFGTAIMHGGTTAIVAIVSKSLFDREIGGRLLAFAPGLGLAFALHSFFNHFFLRPVVSTLLVLVGVPAAVFVVFVKSSRSLERWLDVGFDTAAELLALIHSGSLTESRIGRYLQSLTGSFRGHVVADMLCYLRLHLELSLRAKGELMMRESGFETAIEPDIRDKLQELRYLERSIGPTGKMALRPFLRLGARELWQLRLLER